MTVGTIRSSITNFSLFVTLGCTFLVLAIGHYRGGDETYLKVGGYFGMISASLGWYLVCAGIWNKGNSYITLPLGEFPWAEKADLQQVGHRPKLERESKGDTSWVASEENEKPRSSIARPKSFVLPKDAVSRPKSLGLPPFYSYMYSQSNKI
jgi:hypothetical protein